MAVSISRRPCKSCNNLTARQSADFARARFHYGITRTDLTVPNNNDFAVFANRKNSRPAPLRIIYVRFALLIGKRMRRKFKMEA